MFAAFIGVMINDDDD